MLREFGMSRVLVVEDEPAILRMIDAVLRDAGNETIPARDGESATRVIKSDPPDCVVADVRLPGKGGVELSRELHENGADIPVILISAYDEPQDHDAERFIAKPFDISALTEAVAEVCENGSS
jgi:CheY-like chemotaxis protein